MAMGGGGGAQGGGRVAGSRFCGGSGTEVSRMKDIFRRRHMRRQEGLITTPQNSIFGGQTTRFSGTPKNQRTLEAGPSSPPNRGRETRQRTLSPRDPSLRSHWHLLEIRHNSGRFLTRSNKLSTFTQGNTYSPGEFFRTERSLPLLITNMPILTQLFRRTWEYPALAI